MVIFFLMGYTLSLSFLSMMFSNILVMLLMFISTVPTLGPIDTFTIGSPTKLNQLQPS